MLDLPRIKQQLRVEHDAEDDLILGYNAAAFEYIEQYCGRKIVPTPTLPEEMELTPALEQAALLLITHWYTHREAVVTGTITSELPLGVESLLWLKRAF